MSKPGKAEMAAGRFFFGPFRTVAVWAACAISCAVASRLIAAGYIYIATGQWVEWGWSWDPPPWPREEWAAIGLVCLGVSLIAVLGGRMIFHREREAYKRARKAARERAAAE